MSTENVSTFNTSHQLQADEMTVKRLRTYEGFENITEEEGEKAIKQLYQFAELLYEQAKEEIK